jgi:integrase
MPKQAIRTHKVIKHGTQYWRVIIPKDMRQNVREKFFTKKSEAEDFCDNLESQRPLGTVPLSGLTADQQFRVATLINRVGSLDNLERAVGVFLESNQSGLVRKELADAIAEMVESKRRSGKRDIYIAQMEDVLNIFKRGREKKLVSSITSGEIEEWLHNPQWSGWTRRGYLGRVANLFSFCVRRKYCATNPTDQVERPTVEDKSPGIITVEQGKELLKAAHETDQEIALLFALQMFGFLRPFEARRFTRAELLGGVIDVKGNKAKTRLRRPIKVNATLQAWIDLGAQVPKRGIRERCEKIREIAKTPWSHDCLRHTCVSCAYVIHGARVTSEWAGHSEDMLYRHYRALVNEEQAKAWWSLAPSVVTAPK